MVETDEDSALTQSCTLSKSDIMLLLRLRLLTDIEWKTKLIRALGEGRYMQPSAADHMA